MANPKLGLRMPKDPLEIKLTKEQMDEINLVRDHTMSIYNFHRSMMILFIKEMAGDAWTFEGTDPIKLEFDPSNLMVKISVEEQEA